jgi:hypothetical protein
MTMDVWNSIRKVLVVCYSNACTSGVIGSPSRYPPGGQAAPATLPGSARAFSTDKPMIDGMPKDSPGQQPKTRVKSEAVAVLQRTAPKHAGAGQ